MARLKDGSFESVISSKSKKSKHRKTMVESIKSKYCADLDDVKTSGVVIVFHGRPRKTSESELGYLKNVVLSNCGISRTGIEGSNLSTMCPNVVDLDISDNHFDDWKEIVPILTELKSLKFLNLARNQLQDAEGLVQNWTSEPPCVENLVLNSTFMEWSDILRIAHFFKNLQELHLCENGYTSLPDADLDGLHSLHCLRLNDNKICSWREIWKINHLSSLTTLILSGNPLEDIFYHDPGDKGVCHQCFTNDTCDMSASAADGSAIADDTTADCNRPAVVANEGPVIDDTSAGYGKAAVADDDTCIADDTTADCDKPAVADDNTAAKSSVATVNKIPGFGMPSKVANDIQSNDEDTAVASDVGPENAQSTVAAVDRTVSGDSTTAAKDVEPKTFSAVSDTVDDVKCIETNDTAIRADETCENDHINAVCEDISHVENTEVADATPSVDVQPKGVKAKTESGSQTKDNSPSIVSEMGDTKDDGGETDTAAGETCCTSDSETTNISADTAAHDQGDDTRTCDANDIHIDKTDKEEEVRKIKAAEKEFLQLHAENAGPDIKEVFEVSAERLEQLAENIEAESKVENSKQSEVLAELALDQAGSGSSDTSLCRQCSTSLTSDSRKPFEKLETLCVSDTKLAQWKHVTMLNSFPSLKAVRIKGIHLASDMPQEERRKLLMASLPKIHHLNGSRVDVSEREKSERHLLRHFWDKEEKPDVYTALEKKHGTLTPIVAIDLSHGFKEEVTVTFIVAKDNRRWKETVSTKESARTLRNKIARRPGNKWCKMCRVLHRFTGPHHQRAADGSITEEWMSIMGNCPISRLDVMDGDEIVFTDQDLDENYVYDV